MSIRLIVDTNILVSAFVFGGATKRYLNLVFSAKDIAMLMSDDTIDELGDTLFNERFRKYRPVSELAILFDLYVKSTFKIRIAETFDLCRDPKDNRFLDLAYGGRADYLITGDRDLLALDPFYKTRIVAISDFIASGAV